MHIPNKGFNLDMNVVLFTSNQSSSVNRNIIVEYEENADIYVGHLKKALVLNREKECLNSIWRKLVTTSKSD